jgi:hypothetical protein
VIALAGALADYGIPGCEPMPVAAIIIRVKPTVNGTEVEVDDRLRESATPLTTTGGNR